MTAKVGDIVQRTRDKRRFRVVSVEHGSWSGKLLYVCSYEEGSTWTAYADEVTLVKPKRPGPPNGPDSGNASRGEK